MGKQVLATVKDTFDVFFPGDPAFDQEASDVQAYYVTGDDAKLVRAGEQEPVRYVFRPMTKRELNFIMGEEGISQNVSIRGYATVGVSLVEVIGPTPETSVPPAELRKARVRMGGVFCIRDNWEGFDEEPLASAVVAVGGTAFMHNFRVSR